MAEKNLPNPIFRKEQYLNRIALGEGQIPEYPIFREEFYLDYICKHAGSGFTPTQAQLDAMNSGITASIVGRTLLTPISTPTEKTLIGVDETNSEVQFHLGIGLETENDTSPYDIDVAGVKYTTTAPTETNTNGLKIVVLDSEPSTKYNGWLYLIKED